jgi:hypothetical protein
MPKILKSVQSDGGFSVLDETIIDPTRNIIDANSVTVLDNSNNKTYKKEYIVHGSLDNVNASLEMLPTHTVDSNKIVFVSGFMLGTWNGYPVATYTANANSADISCTLTNHNLTTSDLISVEFANPYTAYNGNYPVTVTDDDEFTFTVGSPLDVNNPVLAQQVEITSYGLSWEFAVRIESAVISDVSNNLSLSAISKDIVKDNIPPGHIWDINPIVNNTTKIITFTPSVTTSSDLELRGNGIRWSGKLELVYTERNY